MSRININKSVGSSSLKRKEPASESGIPNKSAKTGASSENETRNLPEALPADFFQAKSKSVSVEASENGGSKVSSTDLPQGFFDDPVKDAKARNVKFKDPVEEEWEKFQKVITEEENVADNIIEAELEEIQTERTIDEIDVQITNWAKVNQLQAKAEEMARKMQASSSCDNVKEETEEDLDDVDIDDLNAFSNWRTKSTLKLK